MKHMWLKNTLGGQSASVADVAGTALFFGSFESNASWPVARGEPRVIHGVFAFIEKSVN